MQKTFMIGDPHFGHTHIIAYENRPFKTVEEMDEFIISNWNKKVTAGDKVIVFGDFSFYNKEKNKELLSRLKGYKILIMGNRDRRKTRNWWLAAGFDEVWKYPTILNEFYICSHEPMYISESMPYVNIHGHIHSKCYAHKQYVNVSVEVNDYTPVDFNHIISKFNVEEED